VIQRAVPGAPVETMALPLGSYPRNAALAVSGRWGGESYRFKAVFLSGAEPSSSPFSGKFDPANIPRIAMLSDARIRFGGTYWLAYLEQHLEERYVSDGDPKKVTFPGDELDRLSARFRAVANPY